MCSKCKVKNRANQYLVDPRLEELLEDLRQRERFDERSSRARNEEDFL